MHWLLSLIRVSLALHSVILLPPLSVAGSLRVEPPELAQLLINSVVTTTIVSAFMAAYALL